jgi:uncharacterized protein (DUF1778 family)
MAASKTKDDSIRLRCTKQQKTKLDKAAKKAGTSLSSWLLMLGLREAEKTEGGAGA